MDKKEDMVSPKYGMIVLFIMMFIVSIGLVMSHFYSKERIAIENKIETCEDYRDKAKALALSMPLLPDTIVNSVADSLLITLVDLNMGWIIFVLTEDDFEDLTDDIDELNKSLESVRRDYEMTKSMRSLNKDIKELKDFQNKMNKNFVNL